MALNYTQSESYKKYEKSQKQSVDPVAKAVIEQRQKEEDSLKQSKAPTQLETVKEAIAGKQSISKSSSSRSRRSGSSKKVYTVEQKQSVDPVAQAKIEAEQKQQQIYETKAKEIAEQKKQSVSPKALREADIQKYIREQQKKQIQPLTKKEQSDLKKSKQPVRQVAKGVKEGFVLDYEEIRRAKDDPTKPTTEGVGVIVGGVGGLLATEYLGKAVGFSSRYLTETVKRSGAILKNVKATTTSLKITKGASKVIPEAVSVTEATLGTFFVAKTGLDLAQSKSPEEFAGKGFRLTAKAGTFGKGYVSGTTKGSAYVLDKARKSNIASVQVKDTGKPFTSKTTEKYLPTIQKKIELVKGKPEVATETLRIVNKPAGYDIPTRLPATPKAGQKQGTFKGDTYVSATGEAGLKPTTRQLTITGKQTKPTYDIQTERGTTLKVTSNIKDVELAKSKGLIVKEKPIDPQAQLKAKASTPEQIGIKEPKFYEKAKVDPKQLKFNQEYNPIPERASKLIRLRGDLKAEPLPVKYDIAQTKLNPNYKPVTVIPRETKTINIYKPKVSLFVSKRAEVGSGSSFEKVQVEVPTKITDILIKLKEKPIDPLPKAKLNPKVSKGITPIGYSVNIGKPSSNIKPVGDTNIKPNIDANIKPKLDLGLKGELGTSKALKLGTDSKPIQETPIKIDYDTGSRRRTVQEPIIRIKETTETVQSQITQPKQVIQEKSQFLTPPKSPVRQVPLIPKIPKVLPTPKVNTGRKNGYEVFVRKFGKDVSIGKARTKADARYRLGKSLVSTARASGFVTFKGDKIKVALGKDFTKSKKDKYRVVQRREKRISTTGELSEITYKGQQSKRNKLRWSL